MTFHKYGKIKLLGHEDNKDILIDPDDDIIIEEKVDGANFRFMIKDGEVIFGSRTQQLSADKNDKYAKNWVRCIQYLSEKLKDVEKFLTAPIIFYGECMVKHTINYDWDNVPPFIGFDIMFLDTEDYIQYDGKIELFEKLGLTCVPLLWRGKAKDFPEEYVTEKGMPKSKYYDGFAEGITIKNYNKQLFAKFVREKFKEDNRGLFGGSKKYANDDSEKIVLQYCTNARIEKQIFKLIDDGHKLDMPMMAELPRRVNSDIWEENWQTLVKSNYALDMRRIRKQISIRCFHLLKHMITSNAVELKS